MPSFNDILRYLYGLERAGIKPGLERIQRLLDTLGNPEKKFPSIHIAGTNGKGSTSAILFSVLSEAYSTGLYTSPHLIRFNERIRTSSGEITNREIVKAATVVKRAAEEAGLDRSLSFFEFTTAMAFEYFKDKKVDIAVLEVGMGGRWDATNVVTPLLSIVTNVGMDHMEYLGDSVKKIAGEKAGIIKKGIPVITGEEKAPALEVIEAASRKNRSPLYRIGADFFAVKAKSSGRTPPGIRFDYSGMEKDLSGLGLSLRGAYQYKNAACALAALELLGSKGFKIHESRLRSGLRKVRWPGRVEALKKNPLIILDAAHNPEGAAALKESLREFKYRRLILVLGIMADKDIGGIFKELLPMADLTVFTVPETGRAAQAGLLMEKARPFGKTALVKESVKEACRAAIREASQADAVCITGSIFTIGEAKRYLSRTIKR